MAMYCSLLTLQLLGSCLRRSWLDSATNSSIKWRKYGAGMVTVSGEFGGQTNPRLAAWRTRCRKTARAVWNNADLAQIAGQMPFPVLPVYIQPSADGNDTEPPIPFQPTIELTEGPHFGYALQWFTFAAILFVGYPFFLRKQERK
jgi:cytochrome oxidase assembly protein ShyY1